MANGSETGVVVYLGDTATCVVPIVDVHVIGKAITRLPIGFNELQQEGALDSVYLVSIAI